jgi:hypothetical protein
MTSSTTRNNRVIAQERTCERCGQPYPYISSMSDGELIDKYYNGGEIEIDYSCMQWRGAKSYYRKRDPSASPNTCSECHNVLKAEQNLIELKRWRDFRKIPSMEKAMMIVGGRLPGDICFFCAARIEIENHSPRNIYICKDCRAKGLTINDVNKGILRKGP